MPISRAAHIEITTQTDATRLESLSFLSSSMAMKRSRMWGMPKYPSPQARVEKIVRSVYGGGSGCHGIMRSSQGQIARKCFRIVHHGAPSRLALIPKNRT